MGLSGSTLSCVVIDDDELVRDGLSMLLEAHGCDVIACSSVEELFSHCPLRADLVFVDLTLQGGDAVQILRRLAADKFSGAVTLMSGHDARTIAQVQRIGATHGLAMRPFLCKPVRERDLNSLLHAVRTAPAPAPAEIPAPESEPRARQTSSQFKNALEQGQVKLWYQPQISLRDGSIIGFEALARLEHPSFGVLTPQEFLPRPGSPLHVNLAEFVVTTALADAPRFRAEGLADRISINVPLVALQNARFLSHLRACVSEAGEGVNLVAEITEDEALANASATYEAAIQLRLMNIALSIDDFGTGYSSLSRMCDMPFSEVKIDRQFTSGCASDPLKQAICRTVVDLARRVDAEVLAEGIETVADLQSLAAMGCQYGQGFLIGRPLSPEETFAAHRGGFLAANELTTMLPRRWRAALVA